MGRPGGPAGQGPPQRPGPTWACQAEAPTACPGGASEGRSRSSCKVLDRAGRRVRESSLGGRTPSQAPPLWGRSSGPPCGPQLQPGPGRPGVGTACVSGRGTERAGALPEPPPPRASGVAPQAHPGQRDIGAASCPHPHPPLRAWEGCRVKEPVSLKEPVSTLRGGPVPTRCPAWASGSTCWRRGEVQAGLKPPLERSWHPGAQA